MAKSLYDYRWQKASKQHLRGEPLCRMCKGLGKVVEATVVDHIVPHRGDLVLFRDPTNWQSLCKPHHDGAKQRLERGKWRGAGVDGVPDAWR